jgi:hypothetical protein
VQPLVTSGGTDRDDARLSTVLLLLIASVVALSVVRHDSDPDIFGRIAYARDAFARGAYIWHADPYSYTVPGAPWVDHEWGFSWIAFLAYASGGWWAVRLLSVLLMAGTAWLSLATTRGIPGALGARPVLAALLAPVLALAFIGPRAQAFSYLFFAWMLFCLAKSEDASPGWMLWGVVPMPLWMNVHGGVVAGLGIAAVWCALRLPALVRRQDGHGLTIMAIAALWCAGSALLQPWGWNYVLVVAKAGTMPKPFVPEWSAPAFMGPHWVLTMLFLTLGAASMLRKPRRWPDVAVMLMLAAQAFMHRRHLPFFAIAVAVFAFPALVTLWQGRQAPRRSGTHRSLVRATAAVAVAVTFVLLVQIAGKLRASAPHEPDFPAAALSFLRTQGTGGLLVDFEWSQYVILAAAPQFKVAVDGRYEEVYPDDVMRRYIAWHFGLDGWQSLPADPATRFALVAANSSRASRLDLLAPAWQRVYTDPTAAVFIKVPAATPSTAISP